MHAKPSIDRCSVPPMTDTRLVPLVVVHGNPETPAIWSGLLAELARPAVALQLPGFGRPRPHGFEGNLRAYVEWLAAELESIGEPVDLVGHDLGSIFTTMVACERPELLRSWAADSLGIFDVDYEWHDMAQVWQTPGAGEEMVAGMIALTREERVVTFAALDMGPAAEDVADALDDEMGDAILVLYRSMAQPAMSSYARENLARAASRPGLALAPSEDPYTGGLDATRRAAVVAGAHPAVLDGIGHWWMITHPSEGASALRSFWSPLDER
jgi:pimeloyl-ACP methyl ester carboxylesterase